MCSAILMTSRNYPTHWDSRDITQEMNDPQKSFVQLFAWIQEIIVHIEVHSTLHKKWTILTRTVFNYSHEFKKLSYTLRFTAHYIRNERFSPELCSIILMNSKNYPTLRFIAHYIRNEWFWPEFCSIILMNSRNYPTH